MRKKKLTQEQRITALEKALTNVYIMVQALIKDNVNKDKDNVSPN
jgi:hypothetical protein